ncbi:hypothetical protein, partial [Actinomadura bangladeshensis]
MHGQPKNTARSSTSDEVTTPEADIGPARDASRPPSGAPAAGAVPDPFDDTPRMPHWFKTAVFYEVS